jgi:hypothetical protein
MAEIELAPAQTMSNCAAPNFYEEIVALERETARLNAIPAPEEDGAIWDNRCEQLWGSIEALPVTAANAPIKARAVWSIVEGDIENINEGQTTCCRLVRQVIQGFGNDPQAEAERDRFNTALERYKVAHRNDVDHCLKCDTLGEIVPALKVEGRRIAAEWQSALKDLVDMPAPNVGGIAAKLSAIAESYRECEIDNDLLDVVVADAERLAGIPAGRPAREGGM